jgi:hypothetical protein
MKPWDPSPAPRKINNKFLEITFYKMDEKRKKLEAKAPIRSLL